MYTSIIVSHGLAPRETWHTPFAGQLAGGQRPAGGVGFMFAG
jgi:hypothetical protein